MPISSVAVPCGKINKQIFLLKSLNQNYAYVTLMTKKMLKEAARRGKKGRNRGILRPCHRVHETLSCHSAGLYIGLLH